MYQRKLPKDIRCPVERAMDILGGKWSSRVACVLSKRGRLRYNALRNELADVTDAALSAALKSLVDSGVVERTQFEEIPPRVEYSLTPWGEEGVEILSHLAAWVHGYTKEPMRYDVMSVCSLCDFKE